MVKLSKNKSDFQGLSEKQKVFVLEYLVDLNGKQAAIRAGYSEKTAENQASRLLRNVKVKKAIGKLLDKREKRLEVTADKVINELAKLAFSNLPEMIAAMGDEISLIGLKKLNTNQKAALLEVTETEVDGVISRKLKLHPKIKPLEMLGKRLKLWSDDAEIPRYILAFMQNGKPVNL